MRFIILILLCFLVTEIFSQIRINEICADNESVYADFEGDYEDWLELYNPGTNAINLSGYHLSDDLSILNKWTFGNVIIPPQGYLIVFASDKDLITPEPHTNFKLSKDGEVIVLSDAQLNIIDQIDFPSLNEDQSYGRQPDGSDDLTYFFVPSPASTNDDSETFNFAIAPTFINQTFFYEHSTTVELTSTYSDFEIYYTIDGSIPDTNSILYQGPIQVDTTTCINAAVLTPGLLISKPKTRTFFIGTAHELPVVSICADPFYLFDYENGILVHGPNADTVAPYFGANFWQDWEVPVHFEYFIDETLEIEYPLGMKVHGGSSSRRKPLKSVRLMAKSEFGTELMDYPFFYNRSNTKFKHLTLRNASGDFGNAYMRDAFLARYFIDEKVLVDKLAFQPTVVYINGQYKGVMNLREKINRFYFQYQHGANPDNIDLLEEDTANLDGTFDIFHQHSDFVLDHDLSDDINYEIASGYFDIVNLTDYIALQTIVNNTDWPKNNIKYWRERTPDAKWHYLIFDMDVAMGLAGFTEADKNSFELLMAIDNRFVNIFKSFLKNESFKKYFINRSADLLNTTFREDRFVAEVIRSKNMIDFEMQTHVPLWGKTYERWSEEQIPRLLDFAALRRSFARQYLADYFGLQSSDSIVLKTYPEGAGSIRINTLNLPVDSLPWDGYYYNQVPIDVEVISEPGFEFSHWEASNSTSPLGTSEQITFAPRNGINYTAVFQHNTSDAKLNLYPNPVYQQLQVQILSPELTTAEVFIFNSTGKLILSPQQIALTTGNNQFNLDVSSLPVGLYVVYIKSESITLAQKFLKFE